jgi:predicted metal-dependent HD superfamily phosphohydrolase
LPDIAWRAAVSALGGRPVDTDIVARYGEPHRRYHNLTHVRAVVRDAVTLVPLSSPEKAELILAACAHDVVYDAVPGTDEQRSADWARSWLAQSNLTSVADRVSDLVLATIKHAADPDDAVACALLDADLAILGSTPQDYDTYAAAVRQEYSAVDDNAWRTGRSRVLSALLDRDRLYLTAAGHDRWEAPARHNLSRELATLLTDRNP